MPVMPVTPVMTVRTICIVCLLKLSGLLWQLPSYQGRLPSYQEQSKTTVRCECSGMGTTSMSCRHQVIPHKHWPHVHHSSDDLPDCPVTSRLDADSSSYSEGQRPGLDQSVTSDLREPLTLPVHLCPLLLLPGPDSPLTSLSNSLLHLYRSLQETRHIDLIVSS